MGLCIHQGRVDNASFALSAAELRHARRFHVEGGQFNVQELPPL